MESKINKDKHQHFIAWRIATLASEIDYMDNIPNKAAHVEILHAMAKEFAGDRASEIYPSEDEPCQCNVTNLDGMCVDCGKAFA